jgi:hypothetical protein
MGGGRMGGGEGGDGGGEYFTNRGLSSGMLTPLLTRNPSDPDHA